MKIEDLKVGDYIMHDNGGVANCLFGKVTEIHPDYLVLQGVYKRKRVNVYPGESDIFDIEHIHNLKVDSAKIYPITKEEYKEIEKAYAKYFKVYESICTTFRKPYFESKKR